MKKTHLQLEWKSSDGNYVHHRSAIGSGGVTGDIEGFRWSAYSLMDNTIGSYSSAGIADTLLKAQLAVEKHLITKVTNKKKPTPVYYTW